jgi:hypothetical protein
MHASCSSAASGNWPTAADRHGRRSNALVAASSRKRDVDGLERLLGVAQRLDDGAVALAPVPVPTPRAGRARTFPFGDPRRPRSLALALVACIALFPVLWGVLLMLIWMAAVLPAIGLVAAMLDWLHARRSYPPAERGELLGWEGILCLTGSPHRPGS